MEISFLIEQVNKNTTGIFDRVPQLIVLLPRNISDIIGDNKIYLSEFIIAKVKGKIKDKIGHSEINDKLMTNILLSIPKPLEILKDMRASKKFLFINKDPLHQVVIEISRKESGKTEINTIHLINSRELKRLEHKFPVVYSSGGTP